MAMGPAAPAVQDPELLKALKMKAARGGQAPTGYPMFAGGNYGVNNPGQSAPYPGVLAANAGGTVAPLAPQRPGPPDRSTGQTDPYQTRGEAAGSSITGVVPNAQPDMNRLRFQTAFNARPAAPAPQPAQIQPQSETDKTDPGPLTPASLQFRKDQLAGYETDAVGALPGLLARRARFKMAGQDTSAIDAQINDLADQRTAGRTESQKISGVLPTTGHVPSMDTPGDVGHIVANDAANRKSQLDLIDARIKQLSAGQSDKDVQGYQQSAGSAMMGNRPGNTPDFAREVGQEAGFRTAIGANDANKAEIQRLMVLRDKTANAPPVDPQQFIAGQQASADKREAARQGAYGPVAQQSRLEIQKAIRMRELGTAGYQEKLATSGANTAAAGAAREGSLTEAELARSGRNPELVKAINAGRVAAAQAGTSEVTGQAALSAAKAKQTMATAAYQSRQNPEVNSRIERMLPSMAKFGGTYVANGNEAAEVNAMASDAGEVMKYIGSLPPDQQAQAKADLATQVAAKGVNVNDRRWTNKMGGFLHDMFTLRWGGGSDQEQAANQTSAATIQRFLKFLSPQAG